jgi:hypothetical protein
MTCHPLGINSARHENCYVTLRRLSGAQDILHIFDFVDFICLQKEFARGSLNIV